MSHLHRHWQEGYSPSSPSFNVTLCFPPSILPLALLLPTSFPGGSDVRWVQEDVLATAMDSGDVVLWKHGSLGHSLQRLNTLACHDSMVLGLDGPEGSTLLTSGGDGDVTLINVAEEKVVSQYRGVLLCGSASTEVCCCVGQPVQCVCVFLEVAAPNLI